MDTLLIRFDEEEYKRRTQSLEDLIPIFKNCIAIFNSLEIGAFEREDFTYLFFTTKEFLFECIIKGKSLDVGGMKVSKEKLFEMLEKPKAYFTLIDEIEALQKRMRSLSSQGFIGVTVDRFLDFFEFTADDDIQLKWEEKQVIKERSSYYLSSEYAQKLHKLADELCGVLNQSSIALKEISEPFYSIGNLTKKIMSFDISKKKWEIKLEDLLRLDQSSSSIH